MLAKRVVLLFPVVRVQIHGLTTRAMLKIATSAVSKAGVVNAREFAMAVTEGNAICSIRLILHSQADTRAKIFCHVFRADVPKSDPLAGD
jgi:hypothetical protein